MFINVNFLGETIIFVHMKMHEDSQNMFTFIIVYNDMPGDTGVLKSSGI